jgi:hypothetical protein
MIRPAPRPDLMAFSMPPEGAEVLKYTYYSRKTLSAGVQADVQFFSDQVGVSGATLRSTNMTKGSAIGNPRRFLAQFLNFNLYAVTAASVTTNTVSQDVNQVLMQTVCKITVLDKEYLTVPSWVVPSGGGLFATGGGAAMFSPLNGWPSKQNAYPIEINLEREASFSVQLLFPVAVTTTVDLLAEYCLTGLLLRPKQ